VDKVDQSQQIEPAETLTEGGICVRMGGAEDVYILLSDAERAVVHAIQNRKSWECPVDWESTARNLKVGEAYLKALCKIPLPKSNMIALSDLEEARWRVSLDLMWR
jgi:hypothetical protein